MSLYYIVAKKYFFQVEVKSYKMFNFARVIPAKTLYKQQQKKYEAKFIEENLSVSIL